MGTSSSRRLRRLQLQPFDRTDQILTKRRIRHELKNNNVEASHRLEKHRDEFARGLTTRKEYRKARWATEFHARQRRLRIDPPTPPAASLLGLPRELRQQIFLRLAHDGDLADDRNPRGMMTQLTKIRLVCCTLAADMVYVEEVWRARMAVLSALYAPARAHFERVAQGLGAAALIQQTRAVDRRIREEKSRRRNDKIREKLEKRGKHYSSKWKAIRRSWARARPSCSQPPSRARNERKKQARNLPVVSIEERASMAWEQLEEFPAWSGSRTTFED